MWGSYGSVGTIGEQRSPRASTGGQELSGTSCPHCGAEHAPGASPCRESSLVGRTLRAGIRVRERVRDTPLGPLYRAEYPTGLEVAVVLLGHTSADSGALALLRQRCRDAIQIQHPNVAAIHELSETDDGLVYVVGEFLTGELLSETLARRGALPLKEALDLCLQAAAGLQAAHEVGWVHGRLSPDSILLTQVVGGRPLVKLIGFTQESLLRQTGAEAPIEQGVSLEYASPERIAGHPPDERSDVYSLGAVLYHLLIGVPPTLPLEGGPTPKAMRAVLVRALAPSPARRFQTVAEFAAALAPPDEEAAPVVPLPARAGGRRALALGAVAAALVAVAIGLWGTPRSPAGAPTRARLQEPGSKLDSVSASARRPADSGPVALGRRHSAATRIPTDSWLRPPVSRASRDSAPGPKLSPFLRSHPWVAVSGERFYYPSTCLVALKSRDLRYFRSEEEARASGFVPNPVSGCYAS
jgi:serine/threonine protein kinase